MNLVELYNLFLPVSSVLGTICLFVLLFGSLVFALVMLVKKTWKYILAAGAIGALVCIAALLLDVL